MRPSLPKPQTISSSTLKVIIFCLFLVLAILILKTTLQKSKFNGESLLLSTSPNFHSTCTKITPSLASTIIHYATSTITPQQNLKEISITNKVLRRKSPCNFLVFGLGYDSPMWEALNLGGNTVFLEEHDEWIQLIAEKFTSLKIHHITYDTELRESNQLMKDGKASPECRKVSDPRVSECKLAFKGLPREIYEVEWDLIMVDAPQGFSGEQPGRMKAIYTAGLMARNRVEGDTDVFVHDINRDVEDKFSREFLCQGYKVEQEGRLRHFTIPSHRTLPDRPFCP